MDIIWIIWEILLNEASKRNKLLLRNIKSLLHLFCISYHSTVKRKRKFILYHAANLLIEKVNFNIQTETFIKDNSNQIDKMDLVSIYILMDKLI